MEVKHLEKKIRRYVIATLSSPVMYLNKKPGEYDYRFYKNIERATKTIEELDAEVLMKEYFQATNDNKIEMVVLPLDIEYNLIEMA